MGVKGSRCGRRRGSLAVELLFVLPLLLAVLLGMVEFSLWLTAQEQVALASREGARTAATGGNSIDVQQSVRQVLGDARFPAATVQTVLTDTPGDPVAVLVQVPARIVVPDLLGFVGISIQNQVLVSQTVMRRE